MPSREYQTESHFFNDLIPPTHVVKYLCSSMLSITFKGSTRKNTFQVQSLFFSSNFFYFITLGTEIWVNIFLPTIMTIIRFDNLRELTDPRLNICCSHSTLNKKLKTTNEAVNLISQLFNGVRMLACSSIQFPVS